MSTDLNEFRQLDLPEIQLPPIKINTTANNSPQSSDLSIQLEDTDDECLTPTSPEHKIPAILSCPPPPRKQRPAAVVSCKRKLEFFEIVGREEIESFFRSNCCKGNISMKKRRQVCM